MVVETVYYPSGIAVGVFYVDMDNWTLLRQRCDRVLKGVSAVLLILVLMLFQPLQKNARIHADLPRGMMWAIIICTFYIVVEC
jgi:hypothetical protein